jgi:hypothetical protein
VVSPLSPTHKGPFADGNFLIIIPGAWALNSSVVSPLIPGASLTYSPGITMDRGRPIRGGTASFYPWRIWDLCTGGNLVSPTNKGVCSRGKITTDKYISYAPVIVMLAISKSLLVATRQRLYLCKLEPWCCSYYFGS